MRYTRPLLIFDLSLLLTLLFAPAITRADDDEEDYDVTTRVVRLSLIQGDVQVKRHDSDQWEKARLNIPLVEGDTLVTGGQSRAEIQFDARNFLRIASETELKIVTLRNEGIALSLSQGTATLRLARFDKDHEYFEIDAPKTTIAAERNGLYRLDAGSDGSIHLKVRDGGQARVYSETAGFTVRDGHTATLQFQGNVAGDWQLANALGPDDWDEWVFSREQYLASRFRSVQSARYYDADVWGAEDLDAYGAWESTKDYGWIWRPNNSVINNYYDWAPYRFGSWVWCSPYGWTWVGDEPFGWAPYHYGRWVYYNNYWAWCPRSYYYRHRSWWRPALVAFISIDFNFSPYYCWYPLHYHQRDPHSRYYHGDRGGLRPLSRDDLANLRRNNPAYLRAVTSVPAAAIATGATRPQAAATDLARRAIGAEPLRTDLPARPAVSADNNSNRSARTAAVASPEGLGSRPTGAATRQPGVALDNELRRSRIFNGREPVSTRTGNDGGRPSETRATGAVARPARSGSPVINRDPDVNPTAGSNDRPVRTSRPREERPVNSNPGDAYSTPR